MVPPARYARTTSLARSESVCSDVHATAVTSSCWASSHAARSDKKASVEDALTSSAWPRSCSHMSTPVSASQSWRAAPSTIVPSVSASAASDEVPATCSDVTEVDDAPCSTSATRPPAHHASTPAIKHNAGGSNHNHLFTRLHDERLLEEHPDNEPSCARKPTPIGC